MELLTFFLILLLAMLAAYTIWMLLLADSDLILALYEMFGCSVSVFQGKVIWITGASSGLGEAMAYELASVGAKLILSARNIHRLEQVKHKCLEISAGKLVCQDILVLPLDITDFESHKDKFVQALNHFEKVDVLVNNAGRIQVGPCGKTGTGVDKDLFAVNFFGPVNLTKLVLQHFLDRGEGHVVGISSSSGKFVSPGLASYCASKCAFGIYYEALRIEHNVDNIKVTVVLPGFFESELKHNVMALVKGEVYEKVNNCRTQMPAKRVAHLSLVAAANKLSEAWISYQMPLSMMWMSHYFPDVHRMFFLRLYTKSAVNQAVRASYPEEFPSWKPLHR